MQRAEMNLAERQDQMRIAMMQSGRSVNGSVVHSLLLTRYLLRRGHDVLLVHRPGAWIAEQLNGDSVRCLETSFSLHPRELVRVGRALAWFNTEIVHTHSSGAHNYAAATRLFSPIPVVSTAHAMHIQLHWALNNIVIATSPDAAAYHRRFNLVRRSAIRIIPNFTEVARFGRAEGAERAAIRATFGIPSEALAIGSVGDLSARKRPMDLIEAFAPLAARRSEAVLALAGKTYAGEREKIEGQIRRLGLEGKVLLLGRRPDVPRLLSAIDVFAIASGKETGPISVLEAMASGLPVVATDTGMVPEFVVEGVTGFRAGIGAIGTLSDALDRLAGDPALRVAMGAAGRKRVEERYDVEALCPRIEAVLTEAATIRRRPAFGPLFRLAVPGWRGGRGG